MLYVQYIQTSLLVVMMGNQRTWRAGCQSGTGTAIN